MHTCTYTYTYTCVCVFICIYIELPSLMEYIDGITLLRHQVKLVQTLKVPKWDIMVNSHTISSIREQCTITVSACILSALLHIPEPKIVFCNVIFLQGAPRSSKLLPVRRIVASS